MKCRYAAAPLDQVLDAWTRDEPGRDNQPWDGVLLGKLQTFGGESYDHRVVGGRIPG